MIHNMSHRNSGKLEGNKPAGRVVYRTTTICVKLKKVKYCFNCLTFSFKMSNKDDQDKPTRFQSNLINKM